MANRRFENEIEQQRKEIDSLNDLLAKASLENEILVQKIRDHPCYLKKKTLRE